MTKDEADVCREYAVLKKDIDRQFDIAVYYFKNKVGNIYPQLNNSDPKSDLRPILLIMYHIANRGYLQYKMTPASAYTSSNYTCSSVGCEKFIRWFITNNKIDKLSKTLQNEAVQYIRTKYISNSLRKQRLTITENDITKKIDEFNSSYNESLNFNNFNTVSFKDDDPLYIKEGDVVQLFEQWLVEKYSDYTQKSSGNQSASSLSSTIANTVLNGARDTLMKPIS